ncbi:MAG TPA: DNA-binding protein, partial [Nitrococcus sp.]|nr:DNA-binding protein [Nitrococcus sp.]
MARPGITYTQVADAASRLAAAGKNPTIDGIREALGGTGSKSTIAPLLKRWKATHQETVAQAELGLPLELLQALQGVYEKVQAEAAQQRAEAAQAHEAQQAELQEALRLTRGEHEALHAAYQEQERALTAAAARIQEQQDANHRQEVALASLDSEKLGLERRLSDRAAEVTALTRQLTQARQQFEHYQEAVARQRAEERQTAEQRQARLEQELAEVRERAFAQQARLNDTKARLQGLVTDNERLQQSLYTAQEALAQSRSAHDHTASRLAALEHRYHALEQRHRSNTQALTAARTAQAVAAKENTLLGERL